MGKMNDEVTPRDSLSMSARKKLADSISGFGFVTITLRDEHGNIKKQGRHKNTLQTVGKTHLADQLAGGADAAMGWLAIGTGTGQGVGTTVLASELDRQALDGGTPTHAGAVVTYQRIFAAGEGTGTVTEAGLFNNVAADTGDMMLYSDGWTYTKGALDALTLDWDFTIN